MNLISFTCFRFFQQISYSVNFFLFKMSLKVHVDRDRGSRTVSDKDKVKN